MAGSGESTRLPLNVARVKVPAWTPYASREVPKFFRVNLQLLKLQLPLRRSYHEFVLGSLPCSERFLPGLPSP